MAEGTKYHIWLHIEEEAPDGKRFHETHEPDKLATFGEEQEAVDFCAALSAPRPAPVDALSLAREILGWYEDGMDAEEALSQIGKALVG